MGDGRGDCLVVTVLFCRGGGGDSFEENLRCGPKLGALVDLVELDGVGVTFKAVEALRGAFFFSASIELNTKGTGGGGAGLEMIDSNTYLPSILTPKQFFTVSAICLDRLDLTCTCFLGRFLMQSCGRATCSTTFVTRETICSAVKLNVLLGVVVKGLSLSDLELFPLYTGHIFPMLRFFGKTPFLVDLLNITDNIGSVTSMVSLIYQTYCSSF